jgi:hypothetical protein
LSSTAERVAKNESLFREVNERIRELAEHFDLATGEPTSFVCECSRTGCHEPVELTLAEYAAVRESDRQFVVQPGHVEPGYERVVFESGRYAVVEKLGKAGRVSEDLG